MSIGGKANLGLGASGAADQSTKVMQQQIADLERQLAHVSESLEAVVQLSQALSTTLSLQGKRLPTVQKMPTAAGKFKLVLRP